MDEESVNILVLEAISEAFKKLCERLDEILNARKQAETSLTIERITQVLPTDLSKLVTVFDEGENFKVIMKAYLGPDAFTRLNRTLKDQFNAKYVSAGKDSHFVIAKRNAGLYYCSVCQKVFGED